MNIYETIIILKSKMSDEEVEEFTTKTSALISSNGEVTKVDDWKIKKLAYEIKHESEGHYILYTFNAAPELIEEFERVLRINDNVLKHMVIKK